MEISWLGEACVEIVAEQNILIDPNYQQEPSVKPDIILVTHEHDDHFDPEVQKSFPAAEIYAPQPVIDKFKLNAQVVTAGQEVGPGIKVLGCDCYGAEEAVGYYYNGLLHTADASEFPNPQTEIKLVFSACFSDLQEEYLDSCQQLEPDLVIPYHYTDGDQEGIKEAKMLIEELTAAGFKSKLLSAGEKIEL